MDSAQREADHPSNVYLTPSWLIGRVRQDVFKGIIDLDPATEPSNPVGATRFYTAEDNGLEKEWFGNVWVNPPYGKGASQFAAKAIEEKRSALIVMLLASRPDSKWQQQLYRAADDILFYRGRLKFLDGTGAERNTAPFGSVLLSFNVSLKPIEDLGVIVRVL